MQDDLERILIDEETIRRRLDELATQIAHDYRDRELTVIAILNGSVILMADLLRRIPLPLKLDCLSVASYHGGTKTTGELIFRQLGIRASADRTALLWVDFPVGGSPPATFAGKIRTLGRRGGAFAGCLKKRKSALGQSDPV